MSKTKRLYEADGHLAVFSATVLSCEESEGRYLAVLDRTAFFPEGGGQAADQGILGGAAVLDVQLVEGEIVHTLDGPLAVGDEVEGAIDFSLRLARMQCHSGEHIVSGIIHSLFGLDNVGFHLGDDVVTLDFNGPLTRTELLRVEELANDTVYRNLPITVSYPGEAELAALSYRSKLDLISDVRIITIEGIDSCACCAPHLATTGEIGEIKLLDFMRYKGGIRLTMQAGIRARLDHEARYSLTAEVSRLLSVPQGEIADGVRRLLGVRDEKDGIIRALSERLVCAIASSLEPTEGNLLVHEPMADGEMLREIVNRATPLAGGAAIALSGNDQTGYRYVIGSQSIPLRSAVRDYNTALIGSGGGTDRMVQGSFGASLADIRAYFGLCSKKI